VWGDSQKTALSLTISPTLLVLADEAIEWEAMSADGTFRTYGTGLMMAADWSKDDNPSLRRDLRV
jgi:hypothetical protein